MVSTPPRSNTSQSTCIHSLSTIQAIQEMSVVFTPEMFALLDSKTKQKMLAVASGTVNEKPKKVLSPEHLAKLKAGREAAAAKKAAAAAPAEVAAPEAAAPAAVADAKPKKVLSPEHLAKLKAGREAAKAKKEAEKAAPAPEAVAAPAPAKVVLNPEEEDEPVAVAAPVAAPVKKVLSPEHLAKLKAGREAAKAKKEAAKAELVAVSIAAELVGHGEVPESVIAAAAAVEKPKKVLSPEHLAKLKAGREAAKAKKAAEKAAEKAVSEAQSSRSSSPKVKSD